MSKRPEQEWTLISNSGQKIVRGEIIDDGYGIRYYTVPESKSKKVQPQVGSKEFEEMFPIVDIEHLSLEDSFMQYEPETDWEKRVKANIMKAKEIGMKNFRKPCMDPSFADDGETIIYCIGGKPAVGKSEYWWDENARLFMPEKNSRLIDDLQKDVWLGMLIKELVDEWCKVREAWKAVCVDSKDIGHCIDSKNAKNDFEQTGSRKIGKWYDLGNTWKIVKRRKASVFVLFGSNFKHMGTLCPLAFARGFFSPSLDYGVSVGELVLNV